MFHVQQVIIITDLYLRATELVNFHPHFDTKLFASTKKNVRNTEQSNTKAIKSVKQFYLQCI